MVFQYTRQGRIIIHHARDRSSAAQVLRLHAAQRRGTGGALSKPSGYDERSLVSASVSRLARLRCPLESLLEVNEDGAVETLLS